MKKALIITGFDPFTFTGGIETFTKAVIEILHGSDIGVDLVCASRFENVYGLNNEFVGKVYAAGRSLLSLSLDYEMIICNGYYGGGYFPKDRKTFTIFHSTHAGYAEAIRGIVPQSVYLEIRYIVGALLERTAACSARVIAVSQHVKSELDSYYGIDEIEVVPNPVDTDFFVRLPDREKLRHRYGIPADAKTGLFVGRWEDSKGRREVETVVKDMKDVLWLVVTSSGEACHVVGNNIRVFSDLDQNGMRDIYSLSDFLFFPSLYEGFGLAAAEAMACGLPVIGRSVGFLTEVYSMEGFSSLSIPGHSPDRNNIIPLVRARIDQLFGETHFYKSVSRRGRELIERNYRLGAWRSRMKEALCLS